MPGRLGTRREIALTQTFKRAFCRHAQSNRRLLQDMEEVLRQLQEDVPLALLDGHGLSGALEGLLACRCGDDCWIVFALERHAAGEVVVLLDMGRSDEIY